MSYALGASDFPAFLRMFQKCLSPQATDFFELVVFDVGHGYRVSLDGVFTRIARSIDEVRQRRYFYRRFQFQFHCCFHIYFSIEFAPNKSVQRRAGSRQGFSISRQRPALADFSVMPKKLSRDPARVSGRDGLREFALPHPFAPHLAGGVAHP